MYVPLGIGLDVYVFRDVILINWKNCRQQVGGDARAPSLFSAD